MGVGTAIDATNKAVVVSDCSISGQCRYCEETLCVGCSNMPVYIEEGYLVCGTCFYSKIANNRPPDPEDVRLFHCADDYFDAFPPEKEDE